MKLVHLSNWETHRKAYPNASLKDYSDNMEEIAIRCLGHIRNPKLRKMLECSIQMYEKAKKEFEKKEVKEENGETN